MSLVPLNGRALVELGDKYQNIKIPTRSYEAKSNGIVILVSSVSPNEVFLIGKRVFWNEMTEGAKITRNNADYVFVRLADIEGYEDAIQD